MFLRIAFVVLTAAIAFGLWYLFTQPEKIFDVEGEELGSSLSRELDGAGGDCASRGGDDRYRCVVEVDSGDGRMYRLTFDGEDCWQARRVGRKAAGEKGEQVSGCVSLRDFVLPSKLDDETA